MSAKNTKNKILERDELMNEALSIGSMTVIDAILKVVCHSTQMSVAILARVTRERWLACQVLDQADMGLVAGGELPIDTTFCDKVRDYSEAVVIDNVAEDPLYSNHYIPKMYGFQSYISVPIFLGDGSFFGTLCALDEGPRKIRGTPIVDMFNLFAGLIACNIDEQRTLEETRESLRQSRELGRLREEFVAVLGHDLRNPLAVVESCARRLARQEQTEKSREILHTMQRTTRRMAALINNVLDFTSIRLGDGLNVDLIEQPASPIVEQIVDEMRSAFPFRQIDLNICDNASCKIDAIRIGQLLSNLIFNAVLHGFEHEPITISAGSDSGHFVLSVTNSGEPIASEMMAHLFQPFRRGEQSLHKRGLGLGLYIVSEIAKRHGASICVNSESTKTQFILRIPLS